MYLINHLPTPTLKNVILFYQTVAEWSKLQENETFWVSLFSLPHFIYLQQTWNSITTLCFCQLQSLSKRLPMLQFQNQEVVHLLSFLVCWRCVFFLHLKFEFKLCVYHYTYWTSIYVFSSFILFLTSYLNSIESITHLHIWIIKKSHNSS